MATAISMAAKMQKLRAYQATRRKGVDWLLGHLNPDGSLGNPEEGFHFYRAPWTFAATRATAAANAVCGWIKQNMLTPDGKIEGPYRIFDDAYAYRNSALIVGAQLAQQYDLSYRLMPDLLSWQDPRSGGFPDDRRPDGGKSDSLDIPYACGPGFAFLAIGDLDGARQVYRFLKTIYEAQPALPDRFYYAWSYAKNALITEYPEDQRFWYIVENRVARVQRWTVGSIAACFLGRLYLADPQLEYVALARRYQAFSMSATERQFEFPQVCKSGWGSSLLYQITGEGRYLDWTYWLGDWFASTQHPTDTGCPMAGRRAAN
jgi:hypothetical protein